MSDRVFAVIRFLIYIGVSGAIVGMLSGINAKLARIITLLANQ